LRRYLRDIAASPDEFERMPFQDLIRSANEQGLLMGDWPAGRRYRDMRARTSHTYAAAITARVVSGIPDFLVEATYLRDQLARRLS
jgi:Nucleotidyltransferase substrate binding protein like